MASVCVIPARALTGPQEKRRDPKVPPLISNDFGAQMATMLSACGPFWPCVTVNWTFWPS